MPKINDLKTLPNFPQVEEEVMSFWRKTKAFGKSVDMRSPDKSYVFYDGPPFATGMPHYGHLLASTTKDVVPRYWTMKGYRVERVWGWDCHGLPIEHMIEKKLDIKGGKKGIEKLGIKQFNAECRLEVLRLDSEWEKIIERLGRWVDFKNNYKTMDTTFMESVWWGFKQLHDKGLVYEGKKVILYCPRCATPLSNFEIAMDNSYQEVREPSNTYKYKVKGEKDTYLLAWSTTPWNKIATPALAVNPDLKYVKVKQGNEFYILAETTLKMLKDEPYEVVESYNGKGLETLEFELHYDFFPEREGKKAGVVVADNFVTAEEGTGIVTLAVYGEDDLRVMNQHNIQLVEHVDDEGKLKPEVTPWAGMYLLKVNPLVNADLVERELMYREDLHTHNVALCYRCSTRLYYAPVPAWFINVQEFKKDLIAQNENINWFPEYLKYGRFGKGLENAPDWNVSRSRYWGTPMPIWAGKAGKNEKPQLRIIGSIDELKKWAVNPKEVENVTDIHRESIDHIELWIDEDKTVKGRRIPEVFDCWVESGSMPFASRHYPFEHKKEFEANYPAQFVTEYIAQTRAWFYTMHVMSVGIFGKHSFENVLTTGTILAEDGSKMSKSKKNYPDPMNVINEFGVDSLRLYLMSSTVMKSENLNFSQKEVSDIRKKIFVIWWNVYTFYEQARGDQKVDVTKHPEASDIMDRWIVSRVETLTQEVTKFMDGYNVVRASRLLMDFVNELSTWYLRRSRNRLKAKENTDAVQTLGFVLYRLSQLFAPITPFFAEQMHHQLVDENTSIHHTNWPEFETKNQDLALEESMNVVKQLTEKIHAQRAEQKIKVRQPLSSVKVRSNHAQLSAELQTVLLEETNIKGIDWQSGEELVVELDIKITPELKAEGEAREVIRSIQQLRKKAGLQPSDEITVELSNWPADWEDRIKQTTNCKELKKGDELKIVD